MLPFQILSIILYEKNAQSRNRTSDTRIFSPLLYQLSYLGTLQYIINFSNISDFIKYMKIAGAGFEPATFGL